MRQHDDLPAEGWVEMLSSRDRRVVAEVALVLEARGIANSSRFADGRWHVVVPAHQAEIAAAEIRDYETENRKPRGGERRIGYVGAGWPGVLCYIATLLIVAVAVRRLAFGHDWFAAGKFNAGDIMAGQWWRTLTALTIHLDIDHLVGNIGFGAFFGYFVGRYLGNGLGWALIVAAAVTGNAINAVVQSPDHNSIGASTAVFAALGILSAYTWRRGYLRNTPWRARAAPIIAGIALLAFTGTAGENTDLLAHLFGFIAGLGAGVAMAAIGVPKSARAQGLFGLAAIAATALAWAIALLRG